MKFYAAYANPNDPDSDGDGLPDSMDDDDDNNGTLDKNEPNYVCTRVHGGWASAGVVSWADPRNPTISPAKERCVCADNTPGHAAELHDRAYVKIDEYYRKEGDKWTHRAAFRADVGCPGAGAKPDFVYASLTIGKTWSLPHPVQTAAESAPKLIAPQDRRQTPPVPARVTVAPKASVEVEAEVDDTTAPGNARDDSPRTLTMSLFSAIPDPNDPDKNGNGLPRSEDPDDDAEPTPTPTPTPDPDPTPKPTPTPLPPPMPMPGDSGLYWRVMKPEDLYKGSQPSLDGTLGGQVAVQVVVKVGRLGRLALGKQNIILRLQETEEFNKDANTKEKHPFEKNHADYLIRLDDQHWDVWISRESDGSGTVPEPELKVRDFGSHVVRYEGTPPVQISDTPCSTSDGCAGDARTENLTDISYFYTKTILWNTTTQTVTDPDGAGPHPLSTLLGHNGAHTIALAEVNNQEAYSLMFQKKDPQTKVWEDANDKVITTTHEVGNLVITEAQAADGNIDYVRFDSASSDNDLKSPKVLFNFKDDAHLIDDSYRYTVTFVDTDTSTAHQFSDVLTLVPTSQISVNLPQPTEIGCYGFQITIDKLQNGNVVDSQSWRSQYLFFDGTGLEVVGEENEENPPVSFTYRINKIVGAPDGLKPLSALEIVALDGALKQGGTISGPLDISPAEAENYSVTAPVIDDPAEGTGHVIATGADGEASRYRDHQNHRLMPFNSVWAYYRVVSLEGYQSHISINAKKPVLNLEIPTGATGRVLQVRFDKEKSTTSIASGYPKDVWEWLAKFPKGRLPGRSYSPILVNMFGQGDHGSSDQNDYVGTSAAQIGRQDSQNLGVSASRSSLVVGTYISLIGTGSQFVNRNYSLSGSNYDSQSPADLKGISFFNVATSYSSYRSFTGLGLLSMSDIASQIGTRSRLSVGYKTWLEQSSSLFFPDDSNVNPLTRTRAPVAQGWYNALYSSAGGMGRTVVIPGTSKTRKVAWASSNASLSSATSRYKSWFSTAGTSTATPIGVTVTPIPKRLCSNRVKEGYVHHSDSKV